MLPVAVRESCIIVISTSLKRLVISSGKCFDVPAHELIEA